MATPSGALKLSDLASMIRETDMYRAMDASAQSAQEQYKRQKLEQQILYERQVKGCGVTGPGILGGISSPPEPYRHTTGEITSVTVTSPGHGYTPTVIDDRPTRKELDAAHEEIARLKAEIAECDEIIDALVQDISDIDSLRDENATLRAAIA